MFSEWIQEVNAGLGGVIIAILQIGFIAVLVALVVLVVAEIIKAAIGNFRKKKGEKQIFLLFYGY